MKELKLKNFIMLTVAGIINAIGVTLFLLPVKLYDSGVSGLSMLLNRVTGLPLMNKDCYLGYGTHIPLDFNSLGLDNDYVVKTVTCDWITSFSEAQDKRNKELANHKSGIAYEVYKSEYIEMSNITMKDGTHPIKVPSDNIPDDYNGWMFASINVLTKFSFAEYEWYGTSFKGYFNKQNIKASPFSPPVTDSMVEVNGKRLFHGIIFKKLS